MLRRKSLGPITPDMVTTLNSAACAAYGLRFFFDFDGLMKSVYGAVPGIVGKTLGKVVGAVLLAHVAFAYQLKHIMKISDTDIAKCNICYSAAYVGYHIWAHVQGVTKSLEGLVVTVILGLLNAYAGYA